MSVDDLARALVGNGPWIVLGLFVVMALERAWPARRHEGYWPRQLLRDVGAFAVVAACSKLIDPGLSWAGLELSVLRPTWPTATPVALKALGVIVVGDFLQYWAHRAMHAQAALWRAHRWHHEPRMLNALAGYRGSVIHRLLLATTGLLIPALIFDLADPLVLGAIAAVSLAHDLFIHANLPITLGPLGAVVASPSWHRVHHGADRALHGANFGARLVIWDRLFGTHVPTSAVPEEFELGVVDAGVAGLWGRVRVVLGV